MDYNLSDNVFRRDFMLKSGLRLLFGTFTQIIFALVLCKNAIGTVHPLIWFIIIVELLISFCLLAAGIEKETKLLSKFKKNFLNE